MIVAILAAPEALKISGKTFKAGEETPLNKGQAQQLVKAMKAEGLAVEFTYEDIGESQPSGRKANHSKDAQRNSGAPKGASPKRRGKNQRR